MKSEFLKHHYDWWNDATSVLTLEQQGALIRFMGAQCARRSPVQRNTRNLQSIFGCGNVKAEALLRALIAAEMIEVTPDGKLSSPVIAAQLQDRDDVRQKRSAAGELGGRARRQNDDPPVHHSGVTGASLVDHSEVTPASLVHQSDVTRALGVAKPLKLHDACEASASLEKRREEKSPPKPPMGVDDDDRFSEFRTAYPKRNTAFPTTTARKRWLAQIRAGATPDAIIAGAKAYASEVSRNGKLGSEYVKTADSWLYQGRWADFAPSPNAPPAATPSAMPDERWRESVRLWRDRRGYWPYPTPQPNERGTHVPPTILAEFGIDMPEPAGPNSSSRLAA